MSLEEEKANKMFIGSEKIKLMALQQNDVAMHNHDFLEMVYVSQGRAVHTLNDKDTVVKKGDYFIIDYGAFHKYATTPGVNFEIINILFKPEMIDKTLSNCKSFQDVINNYLIKFNYQTLEYSPTNALFHDEDQSIFNLIKKLQVEYDSMRAGYLELMRCYLIEIFIQTMRSINKEDTNVLYNDYSKYIINYIEEHYMEPITLSELSAKLNFSLPYLSKRFQNDVGISFVEHLQKKRVEQACRLLANTGKKIGEVADLVGYNDIKFFNLVFKRQLKMTPREFRRLTQL